MPRRVRPSQEPTTPPARPTRSNAMIQPSATPAPLNKDRSKERQLSKDFYGDYNKLSKTPKNVVKQERGMFTFPEDVQGIQNIGDRKFLVFYFDQDKTDDYEAVRAYFEKDSKARAHPTLDSVKLAKLVKGD